ncbi:MAG TPA: Mrp/NBP35 family ATP-binding protein [Spirochaetia bacterium]|nr:Mrp/NBP35 family ATP-binding protein [Spirochaetia bacterium]
MPVTENAVSVDRVRQALSTVEDPDLHRDLVSLDFIRDLRISGKDVSFTITLTTPACPLKDKLRDDSEKAIRDLMPDVGTITIAFEARMRADRRIMEKLKLPIKTIIAVGSGKGGVGKSTVAANLAVALAQSGAAVGLLDADIYGPNVPTLMGVDHLPPPKKEKIVPASAHGVLVMSMGFLVSETEALVWRGPMIHGALQQLFTEVLWGELDYLLVDLPPGTGDAQLSVAQLVPLTGGVVVTTPQLLAVSDARRGVTAFRKLQVPILGVVENMAGEVFGQGGGEKAALEMGVPFLGRVPLDPVISRLGDAGRPPVTAEEAQAPAQAFRGIARALAARVSVMQFGDNHG